MVAGRVLLLFDWQCLLGSTSRSGSRSSTGSGMKAEMGELPNMLHVMFAKDASEVCGEGVAVTAGLRGDIRLRSAEWSSGYDQLPALMGV